jgi:hypothetical protein
MMKAPSDAALEYATVRSWCVFPVPPGTKQSYKSAKSSNGQNWGATKDPAEIQSDFQRWNKAGIGIPTGKDNGFFVIEIDTKEGHDVDGIASLRTLEAENGQL